MKLFLWFSKSFITVRGFSAEKWCVNVIFPRHMWDVGGWVYERPQFFTSSLIHTLCHVKLLPTRDTMHFPATWFDLSHRTWLWLSLILSLASADRKSPKGWQSTQPANPQAWIRATPLIPTEPYVHHYCLLLPRFCGWFLRHLRDGSG